jgi:hopanoid C-3 methylase
MNILMVRPKPSSETIGLQHLMVVEPLELEILCALKRNNDTVTVVDMILEKRSFESFVMEHQPDVLCVTGYITNVPAMIAYCEIARRISRRITTIAGGVHCEVCPEDLDHDAIDYRVVRNAARIFTDLLNHIDKKSGLPNGVLKKGESPENVRLPEFDFRVPFPDRESCARYRNKYFYIFQDKVALIKTSFGCPYNCSFCFCRVITGGRYFQRPIPEVIQELQQIKEKEVYIVDDDFLIDKERLQEFIFEIKQKKINKHFLVYGRADFIAKNPELLHELAGIGLKTIIVGFESFSDKELALYNKNTSVEMYKETLKVLFREKITCFATIIISPDWDKQDFRNMVRVVKSLGIHFVNLQPLTPLPGTGISFPASQIIIERTKYENWDLAHISVQPSKLSIPEFYLEILKAYNAILFRPKVLLKYLTTYRPVMLLKMLRGGIRVSKQYRMKIKES